MNRTSGNSSFYNRISDLVDILLRLRENLRSGRTDIDSALACIHCRAAGHSLTHLYHRQSLFNRRKYLFGQEGSDETEPADVLAGTKVCKKRPINYWQSYKTASYKKVTRVYIQDSIRQIPGHSGQIQISRFFIPYSYIQIQPFHVEILSYDDQIPEFYNKIPGFYIKIPVSYSQIPGVYRQILQYYGQILTVYIQILAFYIQILAFYIQILQYYRQILTVYGQILSSYSQILAAYRQILAAYRQILAALDSIYWLCNSFSDIFRNQMPVFSLKSRFLIKLPAHLGLKDIFHLIKESSQPCPGIPLEEAGNYKFQTHYKEKQNEHSSGKLFSYERNS